MGFFKKKKKKIDKESNRFLEYDNEKPKIKKTVKKEYGHKEKEDYYKDLVKKRKIDENVEKNIKYSDYLAENLEKNIEYSEHIAERLNDLANSDTGNTYTDESIKKASAITKEQTEKFRKHFRGYYNLNNMDRLNE